MSILYEQNEISHFMMAVSGVILRGINNPVKKLEAEAGGVIVNPKPDMAALVSHTRRCWLMGLTGFMMALPCRCVLITGFHAKFIAGREMKIGMTKGLCGLRTQLSIQFPIHAIRFARDEVIFLHLGPPY